MNTVAVLVGFIKLYERDSSNVERMHVLLAQLCRALAENDEEIDFGTGQLLLQVAELYEGDEE